MSARPHARHAARRRGLLAALVVVAGAAVWLLVGRSDDTPTDPSPYVGRAACAACHAEAARRWTGSHHDLAMDHATSATVLGDFDDAHLEHHGVTSRFFRQGGRFFVNTDGPDGRLADFEVKYVFGVEPLQQYLIELDRGRVQCLQISWDTGRKRWFHIHDEPVPHDDPLHWTGLQFTWNHMCAECHSTNLRKNYDADVDGYATAWSEIDVSCEACHGPGREHVKRARRRAERGETWSPGDDVGLAVRLKGAAAGVEIEHCARCHARRSVVSDAYEYGRPFLDHYAPSLLTEPLYHADGQILDEVYVYGSFLQAKKHGQGVRCTDCHDPHTARLERDGNTLCTACHCLSPPERFPTLRKKRYDTHEHHFHEPGKAGSLCVDCHMTARTYMGVDPRRDHSFRIPRPDLTRKIGTPNACSGCHRDKSLAWNEEALARWYPDSEVTSRPHFGEAFAAARAGRAEALAPLRELARDREQPAIVRATAVRELTRLSDAGAVSLLASLTGDAEALVRAEAAHALGALLDARAPAALRERKVPLLADLLSDPIRLVRVEAAQALLDVPLRAATSAQRGAFDAALREHVDRQRAVADRPDGHMNLALLHEARGDLPLAEQAYRRALALDPSFAPARFNLAVLLNRRGRNEEARRELEAIVARDASDGEAWYSLGLLHAEMERLEDAARALARAAGLLPGRARVAYNQGMVLWMLGRLGPAQAALAAARRLAPEDARTIHALVEVAIERRAWQEAEELIGELARRLHDAPLVRELRERLAAARAR